MTDDILPPLKKNTAEAAVEEKAWQYDTLNRQKVAKDLTPLIASLRDSFVISLDAPYGGGKSYFLINWRRDLDAAGFLSVYFNAWQTDFSDDPLLAFISCIDQQLTNNKVDVDIGPEEAKESRKKLNKVAAKAKNMGVNLFTKAIPIAAKGIARNYLGDDAADGLADVFDSDVEEDIVNSIGATAEEFSKKVLRVQAQKEQSIIAFRDTLCETIKQMTKDLDADKKKLIIFVDELDRCRPTYAVEVLERIKHLFSVPGVVFVLGIDERQVANAMAAVYGSKLDTDGYLRRFIDWRFKLPSPSGLEYAQHLSREFGFDNSIPQFKKGDTLSSLAYLIRTFGATAEACGMSLRQQEQCFTEMNILLRTLDGADTPLSPVMGILLPLRETALGLYTKAFTKQKPGKLDFKEARELFAYLWGKLDAIGGLAKIDMWGSKEEFEGAFLAWFSSQRQIQEIGVVLEKLIKRLNTEQDQLDYSDRKNLENEKEMWGTCHQLAIDISNRFHGHSVSLAEDVRDRLDRADAFVSER